MKKLIQGNKPKTILRHLDHVHHHLSHVTKAEDALIISAFRYINGQQYVYFYDHFHVIKAENLRLLYRPILKGDFVRNLEEGYGYRAFKDMGIMSGAMLAEHYVEPHNHAFKLLLEKKNHNL